VVPTPVLYYSVFHLQADGAVMITGSHNPPEFNGFKVVAGTSTIHGEAIQEVRRAIETGDLARGEGSATSADVTTAYVAEVCSQFHFPRRIRVSVDAGNGVGGPVMHRILEKLNVDATEMFFEMDGRFPNHHPDPTVIANLQPLIAEVRRTRSDFGIAFDGDADRIGVVDDRGTVIYGDQLMIVYAREILTRKPGATFIGEVKCSQLMYDDIAARGGNPIMWKTGHSLIKAKMKETRAELAGEMSGHMFFKERWYGFDDGMYAGARLLEIVSRWPDANWPLQHLPNALSTPELNIKMQEGEPHALIEKLQKQGRFPGARELITIDGVRAEYSDGFGLARASNTTPVVVLRFEADNQAALERIQAEFKMALEAVWPELEVTFGAGGH
jgi:phosphomannomutase/phosphoglucomutase